MSDKAESHLDHTAVRVQDIKWSILFFQEVFDLEVVKSAGANDSLENVWLSEGIQLVSDTTFKGPEGRLDHLGFVVKDPEVFRKRLIKWGALETKPDWYALPDGIVIELKKWS